MEHKKTLEELIGLVIKEGASDLHISEGRVPYVRVSSVLVPILDHPKFTRADLGAFLESMLTPENKKLFLETREIDFSYMHGEGTRFRCNGFFQQEQIGLAMRLIPKEIRSLDDLHLPEMLKIFTEKQQGFFLVVGPIGHGKSTTLAAMVEMINQHRAEHIVTIEDPIEYIYQPKKSIIDQREVRIDTKDFPTALKSLFRQDVDVVLIGEMRGNETMATAVTAAETGHLILSTLHTNNAAQTINRIIDSFPAEQQDQIRIQLAGSLSGIFSQRLIPRVSGGLIPAYELLVATSAVANLIREKRTHEINTVIETGTDQGMIDMNRCLAEMVRKGEISVENAYLYSLNPRTLERLI